MSQKSQLPEHRDYWTEAAFISHYFPSFNNPFKLTLAQWNSLFNRIGDIIDATASSATSVEQTEKDYREYLRKQKRKNSHKVW